MANWQFLRTGNKSNNNRSTHACLFARTASACGAWARMSFACAVPPRLASRLRMQLDTAPERSASACVQVDGGVVFMDKGALVFDGVAISDTSATVRRPSAARAGRALGCMRAAGLRRTGAVCRDTEAQFTLPMAPSRSEGAARSRARGRRCARPCRTHTRTHALVVLACGASTGTGTSGQQIEQACAVAVLVK
jgi:hypothetical protein